MGILGKMGRSLNKHKLEGRDACLGTDPGHAGGSEAPPWGGVCMLSPFCGVQLSETPWTVSCDLGILQARILEWVAVSSSRGSSQSKDRTLFSFLSCVGRQVLYHWCHLGWMLLVLPTAYSAMLGYWSCLCYCIEKSYDKPRQHLKKQIHYFADKGPSSQSYGFSSGHLWM